MTKLVTLSAICMILTGASISMAGVKGEAIEAGADYVMRKFGKEVANELGNEGEGILTNKMETLAAKYGEKETIPAVEKVGPRVFRLVADVGENGALKAIKLMNRVGEDAVWVVARKKSMAIFIKYGDDAADAMIKHREIAESIIEQLGEPSARALKAVSGQNARRLAMMTDDGQLAAIPRRAELLETIGNYGDRAMDWVWNNKGALTMTAVLAKFIENPQPFVDGTVKVVDVATEKVVKPVATGLATDIGRSANLKPVILTLIGASLPVMLCFAVRWRRRHRSAAV